MEIDKPYFYFVFLLVRARGWIIELLSIQLATNTSFYVKVPIVSTEALDYTDLDIKDKPL